MKRVLALSFAVCFAGLFKSVASDVANDVGVMENAIKDKISQAQAENDYFGLKEAEQSRVRFVAALSQEADAHRDDSDFRQVALLVPLAQAAQSMRDPSVKPMKYWYTQVRDGAIPPPDEIADIVKNGVPVAEVKSSKLQGVYQNFLMEKRSRAEKYDRERTLEYLQKNAVFEARKLIDRLTKRDRKNVTAIRELVTSRVSSETLRQEILSVLEPDVVTDLSFFKFNTDWRSIEKKFDRLVSTNFFLARQTEDDRYLKRIRDAVEQYAALTPPPESLTPVWRELLQLSYDMLQKSKLIDKPLAQTFKPPENIAFFLSSNFEPEDIDDPDTREKYIRCRDEYNRLVKRYDRKHVISSFEGFVADIGRRSMEWVKDNPSEFGKRMDSVKEIIKDQGLQATILSPTNPIY